MDKFLTNMNIPNHIKEVLQLQQITSIPELKPIHILLITDKETGVKISNWFYKYHANTIHVQDSVNDTLYIRDCNNPDLFIYDGLFDSDHTLKTIFTPFKKHDLNPIAKSVSDSPLLSIVTTESDFIDESIDIKEQVMIDDTVYSSFDLVYVINENSEDLEFDRITVDNIPRKEITDSIFVYDDSVNDIIIGDLDLLRKSFMPIRVDDEFASVPRTAIYFTSWVDICRAITLSNNDKEIDSEHINKCVDLIYESLRNINVVN